MNLLKGSFPAPKLINAIDSNSKALQTKVRFSADTENHKFISLLENGKEIENPIIGTGKETPQLEEQSLEISIIAVIPSPMAGSIIQPVASGIIEIGGRSGVKQNSPVFVGGLEQLGDTQNFHQQQKTALDFTLSNRPPINLKEINSGISIGKSSGIVSEQPASDVDFLNPINFQNPILSNQRETPNQNKIQLPDNSADQPNNKAIGPFIKLPDDPLDRVRLPISQGIQKTKIVPIPLPSTTPSAILPVIQNAVSQQVIHAVLLQVPTGSTGMIQPAQTIAVQLMPKNLGIVEITISRSNRQLSIVVETNRTETESLLRAEISTISKLLTGAGFSMEEVAVRHNPHLDSILNGQKEYRASESSLADEAISWDSNPTKNNSPETKSRRFSESQMENTESPNSLEPQTTSIKEHRAGIFL